jgi:mRNA interferase MazF
MPEQGDIVLIPVPFTDLSTTKRRPVIVISNATYHAQAADMIVVAMTSNPAPVPRSFRISNADLDHGTLNRPGTVRPDKVYTLAQSLSVRVFGRVIFASWSACELHWESSPPSSREGQLLLPSSFPLVTGGRSLRALAGGW